LVISFVSPHMAFAQVPTRYVFAHSLGVMAFEKLAPFAVLQSRIHEYWARFFSSTLEERLRYSPSDCFESFPFPIGFDADKDLEKIGQAYNDHRSTTMIATGLGLTKTYNRFHDSDDKANDILELRRLHDEMDQAVLRAYGWDDLARRAKPEFLTEETEDDPKYEGRLFWSADFRAEVLSRLLALNAERYAAEHGASTDGKKKKSPVARTTDKRQSELL
jgi:hypothetical protein